jgi:hypothetical protein
VLAEQLRLKLESWKANVGVMVLDHLKKLPAATRSLTRTLAEGLMRRHAGPQ